MAAIGHHGPMEQRASGQRPIGSRSAAWRVAFAATLALAMGSGTFAGYAFGVLGPELRTEFGLSRFQLGLLTTGFFAVGGPLSLVAGRATDRFGARLVMLVAFAFAATAVVAISASPGVLGAAGRGCAWPEWRWRPATR